MEFIKYWWSNIVTGWTIGNNIVGVLQGILAVIVAIVWWLKLRRKGEVKWEGPVLKWVSILFVGLVIGSTILVAPFLQRRVEDDTTQRIKLDTADTEARQTIADLTQELERTRTALSSATNDLRVMRQREAADKFIPLSSENGQRFILLIKQFLTNNPGITNIAVVVDHTEKDRRLWVQQILKLVEDEKIPIGVSGGQNMEKGLYDLAIFYREEYSEAVQAFAYPFVQLFKPPIPASPRTDEAYQISIRMMGNPFFETNGVIYFE